MPLDITAIQTEIEQLDDQLDGLQIEDLLCMGLGEFCIFNLTHAELAMARWILWLALRGYKRRAEEMERVLLARIKTRLLQSWDRRAWLRGYLDGVTSKRK